MKFLDLLRKLGIFRSGATGGTYTSEKDRPTEFLMDDVYDAKKDLINKDDVQNIKQSLSNENQPNPERSSLGRKIFFWVFVILAILFLFAYLSSGFSFRFVLNLILWIWFLFMLKKFAFRGFYSWLLIIILSVFVFMFALIIYPGSSSTSDSDSTSKGKSLKDYNEKVFDIADKSGKLQGTAAVVVKNDKLRVMYHLYIKDNIPQISSRYCNNSPESKDYHYAGNLLTPLSKEKSTPAGAFSQAYCNREKRIQNIFEFDKSNTYQCPQPPTTGTTTDTFVPAFSKDFLSAEEFLAATTYEVYDGSNAWIKNEDGDGCTLKDTIAIGQGKKIRTYDFTLTEKTTGNSSGN